MGTVQNMVCEVKFEYGPKCGVRNQNAEPKKSAASGYEAQLRHAQSTHKPSGNATTNLSGMKYPPVVCQTDPGCRGVGHGVHGAGK
jgi:hypothetical protein